MIRTLTYILNVIKGFASPSLKGRAGVGLLLLFVITGCARMGNPDGGWYDEVPPKVVGATPAEHATNVKTKKITITFSEYIKLENASENVVICPPQLEMPDINVKGKNIVIELQDSLKDNTTYTIDFSDAITDATEKNPMGNYTYVFSTGDHIDTLAVSGYVLSAEDLEPVKGILVGLYDNLEDSVFTTAPMLRTGRTDGAGHFSIRGVAPGQYRIYALMDTDGDFKLSQRGEQLAFSHDIIEPSCKPDTRPDTTWLDSLHIGSIKQIPYTHFLPDDICLRAFTQTLTDRYLIKTERADERKFSMYFSAGSDTLPAIRGLNFNDKDAFCIETSAKLDTITYWLRDTTLINQDSLQIEATYLMTDTLGNLVSQTDTLELIPKLSYEKRTKLRNEEIAKWEKKAEKDRKKGKEPEPMKRYDLLEPKYMVNTSMAPNENVWITFPTPLEHIDTAGIHLYSKIDTLWYRSPIEITSEGLPPRTYMLRGEWRPDVEYSLEIDSACFRDIYGNTTKAYKAGIKVANEDQFGSLFVNISLPNALVQLMDKSGKQVTQQKAVNGVAEFYYIKPAVYYIRAIADNNGNGKWDTGDYALDQQPEEVYYYPKEIEVKAKWDIKSDFTYNNIPLYEQKPRNMVKQKDNKKQVLGGKNARRAQQLGIIYDRDKVDAIFMKQQDKAVIKAAKKFQSSAKEGTK